MALGLSFFNTRWAACQNVEPYEIPQYGIVEIVGIDQGEGHADASPIVFRVKRPSADNISPIGIVGPGSIPPAIAGSDLYPRGYMVFDGLASVEPASTLGSTTNLGASQNSYKGLLDGIGMRGLDYDGVLALVSLSGPDLANLPVVNQPDYAICLDSSGCLCKTPVNTC